MQAGVVGNIADGFRCKRSDGTIQEMDLAEDLVMGRETYGCVEILLSGRHS